MGCGGYVSCIFLQFLYDSFKVGEQEPFLHVLQMCSKETGKTSWRSESMFGHALKCGSWLLLMTIITTIKSAESKKSVLSNRYRKPGWEPGLVHFRTHNTAAFYFNEIKKGRHPTLTPLIFCRQNWSCHLEPPNTDHMWVQHWQSDYIVEQAVEFIRKKLARRSAGLSPIGQSHGPLRLRAPQTFLRIIFSIPLLSSVRTDQITAQGLHCEGFFKKSCFQCCLSFMRSLSLTS